MLKTSKKFTYYQLRFLFDSYKAGAFLTHIHTYSPQAKKAMHFLKDQGLLEIKELGGVHGVYGPQISYLLILTDQGVEIVKREFLNFLQNAKLHLKHSLLTSGDQIIIHKTVTNSIDPNVEGETRKYVRSPHTTLEAGTYTLAAVDMRSLLLVSDENKKYRINSYHCRDIATLKIQNLKDVDAEIYRRSGPIHVRKLSQMLLKEEQDNFKVTKIINQLQKSNVYKGRAGGR